MMVGIIDAALGRSRTVLMALALVLIAGTVAYIEIPKESEPDVAIPIIYVSMTHEGISPEDAERLLVRPMEEELRSIEGIKEMRATAFEGGANVVLEFDAGFDSDKAMEDVRAKVDIAKTDLPDDTDEPTVNEVNVGLFPILLVTLSGDVPERVLVRLARDLQEKLEGLPNVLSADIGGDRDELVEIVIEPLLVESYGLSIREISEAMRQGNRLVAAGNLDTGKGRFALKVPGLFEEVSDILDMPVTVKGDAVVRLRDIATARRTFKDRLSFARVNGRPALALEISKRTGTNIIETVEQVRAVIQEERRNWPAGVEVAYSQDKSADIQTMLNDLQNNVIAAVLLIMIVVVAILGPRSGLLVGMAIPGSFLAGILVLGALGLTINMVVLFSLILAVGMLVDGAIVVTEYADRKRQEGLRPGTAYGLASKRMAWPIIASTATTLAAFVPLLFWPGIMGEFMKFLPITLLATLTASLAMALIFVPTLGAVLARRSPASRLSRSERIAAAPDMPDAPVGFTATYQALLVAALRHPAKILAGFLALLVTMLWLYGSFGKGVELFPDVEPDNAILQVHARGNFSIDEKDALVAEVERRVIDFPAFETVYVRSGQQPQGRETAEDTIGTIQLELTDWRTRRPAKEILADVEDRLRDLAGIEVERREQEMGPPVGKAVQVQLASRDPALLAPAVARLRAAMAEIGDFENVEDSRPIPGIEWEIDVDRAQAAKFGADVSLVGRAVQMVSNGINLGEYRPDDSSDEVEIRARYPVNRRNLAELDNIRLQTRDGMVPVSNFIDRKARPKTGTIDRVDGRRVMTVKADVAPGILADDKVRQIQAWLAANPLDPAIGVTFKGENEEQEQASAFLSKAFFIAVFMIAIILVTQFNSFYSAFLILSAVIMSTIGVLGGLLLSGQPFGIVMSGVGVIALAGIVVNNNIVFIDTFDRLRAEIDSSYEAILYTGRQRLRPVLLTTTTTILGLLPMMLGINIDFLARDVTVGAPAMQWWSQLATTIVSGLAFATLLTLVATPCALMLRENVRARRLRRARAAGADESAQAAE